VKIADEISRERGSILNSFPPPEKDGAKRCLQIVYNIGWIADQYYYRSSIDTVRLMIGSFQDILDFSNCILIPFTARPIAANEYGTIFC
jgi:hypothetical protein